MDNLELKSKEQKLLDLLSSLDSVIVAYSGGVDSSLLAYYARNTLKDRAKVVIAVSPSLAADELEAARAQADQFGWDLVEIRTDEVDKPEYQRNDPMRCYFCKTVLFDALEKLAASNSTKYLIYGANRDDLRDFRPGHKAAAEHKVLSPLQEVQLSKGEIRELARQAGLPSWDRPQAACLSSRFRTYEPITVQMLNRVEQAEQFLHSLGFRQVRVRHHGDIARIELDEEELAGLSGNMNLMRRISAELKLLGYAYVALDMEGYRQGSANRPARVEKGEQWTATS